MEEENYQKYCFENLPDEWARLRGVGYQASESGRTGTEAFYMASEYEKRQKFILGQIAENLKLTSRPIYLSGTDC